MNSEAPTDWGRTTLAELILLQRGFDLPSYARRPGGVPVVASTGIAGFHAESKVSPPGVVMGRSGSIGGGQLLTQPFWPLNTTLWVKDFRGNDPRFVYYLLRNTNFLHLNAGSGVPTLNRNHLTAIEVGKPPLDQQRRIAWLLGSLDEKIEIHRRMTESLGQIAATLFSARTRTTDPPLKEWEIVSLGEHVDVIKGRSYKSTELSDGSTALVTLKSVMRGGGYSPEGAKPYVGPYNGNQVVQPGEIVVAHTDLTQAAEVIGRPARIQKTPPYETLVASLDLAIVRPKTDCVSALFLLSLLSSDEFKRHARGYANGSTVLHLNKRAIVDFSFALPPRTLIQELTNALRPVYALIDQIQTSTRTLIKIKAELLPRVVSGELRVSPEAGLGAGGV